MKRALRNKHSTVKSNEATGDAQMSERTFAENASRSEALLPRRAGVRNQIMSNDKSVN